MTESLSSVDGSDRALSGGGGWGWNRSFGFLGAECSALSAQLFGLSRVDLSEADLSALVLVLGGGSGVRKREKPKT